MRVTEISINGEVTIEYSEPLNQLNATMFNASDLISIQYRSMILQGLKIPELISFEISNITENFMIVTLEFTFPLYVSSDDIKDQLFITLTNGTLFEAQSDGFSPVQNYALNMATIPALAASEEDYQEILSLGDSASKSMLLTLVVPLLFMVFMSVSMERVWAVYNMLQLVVNINNYPDLKVPANAQFFFEIVTGITNFSIFEDKNV